MQEPSIFTRIINNELPGYRIYEDDRVIAILTINPLCDGHTLVIPKKQVDQIWDMDQDDYDYLWDTAKTIAIHIREVMNAIRVGVVIKGFEVPHTHIHLIPVMPGSNVNFDPEPAPPQADPARLAEVMNKLKM